MIVNYADLSANERTFLAWVRTAAAIVGFGLAAARIADPTGYHWSELALVGTGALIVLIAYIRMIQLRKRIRSRQEFDDEAMAADTMLVLLVVALFFMLAIFGIHVS